MDRNNDGAKPSRRDALRKGAAINFLINSAAFGAQTGATNGSSVREFFGPINSFMPSGSGSYGGTITCCD